MSGLPTILIDSNEAQERRNDQLMRAMRQYFGNDRIVKTNLPVDISFYSANGQGYMERKVCPSDFVASIADGRLAKQCAFLAEHEGSLLLEGTFRYDRNGKLVLPGGARRNKTGWNVFQITGMIASIQRAGITVWHSSDEEITPMIIHEAYSVHNRNGSGQSFMDVRKKPSKKRTSAAQEVLFAFQGLGMGTATAKACWRASGSLQSFVDMDLKELKAIPGIGPERASKVREILERNYG